MEQKNLQTFNIYKKYVKDIKEFCSLNNIEDLELFINQCFKQGFDIKKYGLLGNSLNDEEELIKIGGIGEQRVEVPVEVIKEVIKYVEVPVEKIVNIYDKSDDSELLLKIQQLENEMSKKDEELDELRQSLDILRHSKTEKTKNDKTQMLQDTLAKLRAESLKKDETIKELQEKINKLNNKQGDTRAIYHQNTNLKNNI